jgi:hypothetical protein
MQSMWSNSVAWRLSRERMASHCKYSACYKTLYRNLELDGFFGSRIKIMVQWQAVVSMEMKLSYYYFCAL